MIKPKEFNMDIRMSQEDYEKLDLIEVGITMHGEFERRGKIKRPALDFLRKIDHETDWNKLFRLVFFRNMHSADEMIYLRTWMVLINTDNIEYIDVEDDRLIKAYLEDDFVLTDGPDFTTVKSK